MVRYVRNTAPDYSGGIPQTFLHQLNERLSSMINQFTRDYSPDADYSIDCRGKRRSNYTVYSGAGGNVVLYDKVVRQYSRGYHDCLTSALRVNMNAAESDRYTHRPTFFQGNTGIFALKAVIDQNEHAVLKLLEIDRDLDLYESEVLYGLAGYLYCLLLVLSRFTITQYKEALLEAVNTVVQELIRRGDKNSILKYEWHGKRYLGGAHGTFGVLQMLLLSKPYLQFNIDLYIKSTLDYLISLQFPSGNFPSSEGKEAANLVHFCHGATGAVFPLCEAFKEYGDTKYLDAALRCGDLIWEKGLLLKGFGLCHGISGNGYAFLKLYKTTGDDKWYYRAIAFADKILSDEDLKRRISDYEDPQRKEIGVPDTPYSYMEGYGGTLCFLIDILNPREAKFEGYEI